MDLGEDAIDRAQDYYYLMNETVC
ncbi:hypothetical protein QY895_01730 [Latilactobacillus sakei]